MKYIKLTKFVFAFMAVFMSGTTSMAADEGSEKKISYIELCDKTRSSDIGGGVGKAPSNLLGAEVSFNAKSLYVEKIDFQEFEGKKEAILTLRLISGSGSKKNTVTTRNDIIIYGVDKNYHKRIIPPEVGSVISAASGILNSKGYATASFINGVCSINLSSFYYTNGASLKF